MLSKAKSRQSELNTKECEPADIEELYDRNSLVFHKIKPDFMMELESSHVDLSSRCKSQRLSSRTIISRDSKSIPPKREIEYQEVEAFQPEISSNNFDHERSVNIARQEMGNILEEVEELEPEYENPDLTLIKMKEDDQFNMEQRMKEKISQPAELDNLDPVERRKRIEEIRVRKTIQREMQNRNAMMEQQASIACAAGNLTAMKIITDGLPLQRDWPMESAKPNAQLLSPAPYRRAVTSVSRRVNRPSTSITPLDRNENYAVLTVCNRNGRLENESVASQRIVQQQSNAQIMQEFLLPLGTELSSCLGVHSRPELRDQLVQQNILLKSRRRAWKVEADEKEKDKKGLWDADNELKLRSFTIRKLKVD